MKGKHLVWAVGGAGILLGVGLLVNVLAGITAGKHDRPVFGPEWTVCDGGDICVAVQAPCGEWQPVNAKHEVDAAAYYDHLMTVVEATGMECVSTNLSRVRPAASCRSGACSLAQ
jgi:hypothetical protein